MENLQRHKVIVQQVELEELRNKTICHNILPGDGWRLCFVVDDGEIYTPDIITFEVEGTVSDNELSARYFDKYSQRIEFLDFHGRDRDFRMLLAPRNRIPLCIYEEVFQKKRKRLIAFIKNLFN